jgi:hypothetical protein
MIQGTRDQILAIEPSEDTLKAANAVMSRDGQAEGDKLPWLGWEPQSFWITTVGYIQCRCRKWPEADVLPEQVRGGSLHHYRHLHLNVDNSRHRLSCILDVTVLTFVDRSRSSFLPR